MIMMNKEVKVLYDEVFCIGAVIHEIEKNEFPGLRPGLPCWICEPHVNSTTFIPSEPSVELPPASVQSKNNCKTSRNIYS